MGRRTLVALLVGATLVIGVGAAGARSPLPAKQHYANFGPFCVSKSNGIMRAVATGQKCHKGERRIAHKRIPIGPGARGQKGETGPTGAASQIGAVGPAGATG